MEEKFTQLKHRITEPFDPEAFRKGITDEDMARMEENLKKIQAERNTEQAFKNRCKAGNMTYEEVQKAGLETNVENQPGIE